MGHVDGIIQNIRRGGWRRVAEDDTLWEGGVGGGERVGGGGVVGRGLSVVGSVGGSQVGGSAGQDRVVGLLLLLDPWRGRTPPTSPHAWIGGVGVVLGSWTLQVVFEASMDGVSVV